MKVGDVFTCAETGNEHIVAKEGCSFNYSTTALGDIISDEGVLIRAKRDLANRGGPVVCYLSSDLMTVTTWKGQKLGTVVNFSQCSHPWAHRRDFNYYSFTVKDCHGGYWYGRGSRSMLVSLRPKKG